MFSPLTLPSAVWQQVVGINGTEGIEHLGRVLILHFSAPPLPQFCLLIDCYIFPRSSSPFLPIHHLLLLLLISYRRILLFGASFRSALSRPCRSITKNYERYLSSHSISDSCITHPQLYLQSFTGLLYSHCSSRTNSQVIFICMYHKSAAYFLCRIS